MDLFFNVFAIILFIAAFVLAIIYIIKNQKLVLTKIRYNRLKGYPTSYKYAVFHIYYEMYKIYNFYNSNSDTLFFNLKKVLLRGFREESIPSTNYSLVKSKYEYLLQNFECLLFNILDSNRMDISQVVFLEKLFFDKQKLGGISEFQYYSIIQFGRIESKTNSTLLFAILDAMNLFQIDNTNSQDYKINFWNNFLALLEENKIVTNNILNKKKDPFLHSSVDSKHIKTVYEFLLKIVFKEAIAFLNKEANTNSKLKIFLDWYNH